MNIHSKDRPRIVKIIMHELGHYFAALELGFQVFNLSLEFFYPKGHHGSAELNPCRTGVETLNDIVTYLESRIIVLYAGVVAESIDAQGNYNADYAYRQWTQEGGVHDHAKIRELSYLLRNISNPGTTEQVALEKELKEVDDRLINEAGKLISGKIKVIRAVAKEIADKIISYGSAVTVKNQEIEKLIIKHSLPDEPPNNIE